MKKEHNFSKGKRGQFYNADAKLNLPDYLENDIDIELTEEVK